MRPYHLFVVFKDGELDRNFDKLLQTTVKWGVIADENRVQLVKFNTRDDAWWSIPRRKLQCRVKNVHSLLDHKKTFFPKQYGLSLTVHATLFAYDYAHMRAAMMPLRTELLAHVMHPSQLQKLRSLGLV
jgi:hypothetical protein